MSSFVFLRFSARFDGNGEGSPDWEVVGTFEFANSVVVIPPDRVALAFLPYYSVRAAIQKKNMFAHFKLPTKEEELR